jgi:hypothetical protein
MDDNYAAFAKAWIEAQRPAAKAAYAVASAFDACDMFAAVLADPRFVSAEMMREALRPALLLCQRPPIEPARQRHIRTWLDMVVASWALEEAVEEVEGVPDDVEEVEGVPDGLPPAGVVAEDAPPAVTPADFRRGRQPSPGSDRSRDRDRATERPKDSKGKAMSASFRDFPPFSRRAEPKRHKDVNDRDDDGLDLDDGAGRDMADFIKDAYRKAGGDVADKDKSGEAAEAVAALASKPDSDPAKIAASAALIKAFIR